MNIAATQEIRDVCRICLSADQSNQRIFHSSNNDAKKSNFSLLRKLVFYGGIEVLKDDGLPDIICLQCVSKINAAHELRTRCQEADERLRKAYGKPLKNYYLSCQPSQKDQYCQTDSEFLNVKDLNPEEPGHGVKRKEVEAEEQGMIVKLGVLEKKESLKPRRASVFKRVTSIENLRNHKERQRQYIKKKPEPNDRDSSARRNASSSDSNADHESGYTCSTCDRSFSSEKSLERHVSMHAEKFKCDYCGKQFFQQEKLMSHEKLHEAKRKDEPVRCKICEKSFRKTDTMVRHLNIHKKANPREVFDILKELREKRKSDKASEEKKENLSDDSKSEHVSSNGMDSGNVADDDSADGAVHSIAHEEKKFSCHVCNMKFARLDRLSSHRKRYGHDKEKDSDIEKPPDDKSALKLINSWIREELDSDNEGKGFPCEICGKSYVTKKSLLKHRVNAHESQNNVDSNDSEKEKIEKAFTCTECHKSFEKESKLQKHQQVHERAREQQDFKRFLCHICSKTFRQNTGLLFHMRTHTGYKPHICKYCGRGFTSNSNCINHERTHTGDRPFICQYCSAAFAKSCTLKAHLTTHTGEANYHCKTCGKSFRRLKYLKEHRFTHTGEKPFACKLCGTAYSHSGSLFVHEKKCKAHFSSSYQAVVSQGGTAPSYCQISQDTPILATLPSQRVIGNVVNVQRNEAQTGLVESPGILQLNPVVDAQNASSPRNFGIIDQQVFQSS